MLLLGAFYLHLAPQLSIYYYLSIQELHQVLTSYCVPCLWFLHQAPWSSLKKSCLSSRFFFNNRCLFNNNTVEAKGGYRGSSWDEPKKVRGLPLGRRAFLAEWTPLQSLVQAKSLEQLNRAGVWALWVINKCHPTKESSARSTWALSALPKNLAVPHQTVCGGGLGDL